MKEKTEEFVIARAEIYPKGLKTNELQTVSDVMSPSQEQLISKLVGAVSEGKCILFLGAGVHSPPPDNSSYIYSENERPPLGAALSATLAERTKFSHALPKDSIYDLKRVSLYYEIMMSRRALIDELDRAVNIGKKPSPVVRALAQLNFPIIITTNYDCLFETALEEAGKAPLVSVYNPSKWVRAVDHKEFPTSSVPLVFKMHGDVKNIESIVITDEDYVNFIARMMSPSSDPIPRSIRSYMQIWPTLFIGYSLLDYTFRLISKNVDVAMVPTSFVVDRSPDPLRRSLGSVLFIEEDLWTFVPNLYQQVLGQEMT